MGPEPEKLEIGPSNERPNQPHLVASLDRVLPCDVMVPPRTIIRAGCKFSTLLRAIDAREGLNLRFDSPKPLSKKDYEESLLQLLDGIRPPLV